jgi:hypothetical protein
LSRSSCVDRLGGKRIDNDREAFKRIVVVIVIIVFLFGLNIGVRIRVRDRPGSRLGWSL